MALDAGLVAAATLRRATGTDPRTCSTAETTHQLQLAHVLLDGGYDGVATLEEALAGGDHGLGTVDRLDGELVVVDGQPWRVDYTGAAELMPPSTRTPFVVVATMHHPRTVRLRNVDRATVAAAVEDLVDDPGAVISVRLEGSFTSALVRSVPPQSPPYRPYIEVCATDEVRWLHEPFDGVFVGFRFPDLDPGATIAGLHLHGLNHERTTGGHNHDLVVDDAVLSVSASRDVVMHLPDRAMADLLETPPSVRAVQRVLLRRGPSTIAQISAAVQRELPQVTADVQWLADRGFVSATEDAETAEPLWSVTMRAPGAKAEGVVADILDLLD